MASNMTLHIRKNREGVHGCLDCTQSGLVGYVNCVTYTHALGVGFLGKRMPNLSLKGCGYRQNVWIRVRKFELNTVYEHVVGGAHGAHGTGRTYSYVHVVVVPS